VSGDVLGSGRIFWDGENLRTALNDPNSDANNCNFANTDTLECSGSGASFYQPISGHFFTPILPIKFDTYEGDSIKVIQTCGVANCWIIYDDHQLLVVDTGIDEASTNQLISDIKQTLNDNEDVEFRAVFVTHTHSDHVGGVFLIHDEFPDVPIYCSDEETYIEIGIMWTKTKVFNDPTDNILKVITDVSDIWEGNDDLALITHRTWGYLGETHYYAMLWFPDNKLFFSGDHILNQFNLWFGSSDFVEQCTWLSSLVRLQHLVENGTTIFPGHGPIGYFKEAVQWNIDYLTDARDIYALSCSLDQAASALLTKYPEASETAFIFYAAGPARIPGDAEALGCDCSSDKSCVDQGYIAPKCYIHEITEDDCTDVGCLRGDDKLSGGQKAGIVLGSVGIVSALTTAFSFYWNNMRDKDDDKKSRK